VTEIVFSDDVSHKEIVESAKAGALKGSETGRHVYLLRFDDVKRGPSPFELIDQVDRFHLLGVSRGIKMALMLPKNKEIYNGLMFYETACLNRGYQVKVFEKHEDALHWLKIQHPTE
jgi:hypothetical protein